MRIVPLLALFASSAWAHPGADAHLHATESLPCSDGDNVLRRVGALADEGRLADTRAELERLGACGAPSSALSLGWARLALLEDQPDRAVALLNRVLANEPGTPAALLLRAQAHDATGRPDLAARDAESMVTQAPNSAEAWLRLADLYGKAERPKSAADALERGIDSAGPLAVLVLAAMDAHAASGDLDQALARAAELPRTPTNLIRAAELYTQMGRPAEAANAMATARDLADAMRESPRKRAVLATLHAKENAP